MHFYIHTGNHNSSHSITDTVLFLKAALQDCGHPTGISHGVVPGHVNLVLEHFVEERHLRALLDGRAAGARFILIGTEPIIGRTFNASIEGSHWHYSNADYWQLRFDAFSVAAKMADAIWVLAESMVPGYAQLFPDVPVQFLPHGHVNDFATVRQRPEAERDIDFYFSGSLTDHRKRILQEIAQRHVVVCNDQNTPEYLRQDQLSRSKVCLSLRLSPHNDIPSVSRMHFHLQNRSFLLHEAYALPCPLDPFVLQTPTDDLATWARAALALPNRREIAVDMYEKFKIAMPMTRLLPPLLDEALSRMAQPVRPSAALAA
jgi:hypothetical protein